MTHNEQQVLHNLENKGIIPFDSIFQITELQLKSYIAEYHKLYGKTDVSVGSKGNYKFARRLAGRTLLSVNFSRDAKFSDLDAGILYLIENPAFPDHYKVGMTINLKQRLSQYQTYDPYRKFSVAKYDFVLDRKLYEKQILNHPDIIKESGEWVLKANALEIFKQVSIPV